MDKMIEVRYAGVVVGRTAIIRELDTRGLFLGITEPLPVGTAVVLRIGDKAGAEEVPGRVELVSEAQELSHAGMRVRFADPRAAVLFGTPVEAPPETEPVPEPYRAADPVVHNAEAAASPSVRDQAAPEAAIGASPTGHRRIVVDASADNARAAAAAASASAGEAPDAAESEGDLSGAVGGDKDRIPAPDPSAFGGEGGKKGRRNRRR
ncbi:MAG: hypothetical protein H7X95_00825 [Deltaproteobacteria bacterium]|nr:hypothetical protein [Deltaproteobacteria bacterium]